MVNSVSTSKGQVKHSNSLSQAQSMALQGVKNQNFRFKVIAENMSNSESTASVPGGVPYTRKQVIFHHVTDPRNGAEIVRVKSVTKDKTEYPLRYDPGHPAADEKGMVRLPNVNRVVESVDMITTKNSQSALLKIYNEATSMRRLQIESGMK